MIIGCVSHKGGVGKTTTALNLAIYFTSKRYKTLLIDADLNESLMAWAGLRKKESPLLDLERIIEPGQLEYKIAEARPHYDTIIIDGQPSVSELNASIMLVSDICVFPLLASLVDIIAFNQKFLPKFYLAQDIRPDLVGVILMNMLDHRKKATGMLANYVKDYDIPTLKTQVARRAIYEASYDQGLGVLETNNRWAKDEINSLGQELTNIYESILIKQ